MVNQVFVAAFYENVRRELEELVAGQPAAFAEGIQVDHYKGLASSLALHLVPLMRERYQATESLYGYVPLRNPAIPHLFYQFSVLDVKGRNICGMGNFGAVVRAPIRESYVVTWAGWGDKMVPISALKGGEVKAKEVYRGKVNWSPLLEAVNEDKTATKAFHAPMASGTVGDFKVKVDSLRLIGLTQLAPYHGQTLLTMESAPDGRSAPNRPYYLLRRLYDGMLALASRIVAHPERGEDVGQLFIGPSNAAMMELMMKTIDAAATPPVASAPSP